MDFNSSNSTSTSDPEVASSTEVQLYLNISSYLWMVVSPALLCFGIFGGVLTILVLFKMNFCNRNNGTLIPVFVLSLTDMVVLCVGLSRYWTLETLDYDLRSLTEFGCQTNLFVIYLSMQYSSWVLVAITFERFLKSNFTLQYLTLVSRRRIIVFLLTELFILSGVNSHFYWTHTLENNTCTLSDDRYKTFDDWFTKIDLALLSLIPFIIMSVLNVFILKSLKSAHQFRRTSIACAMTRTRLSLADRRITKTMLFTSIYFLISTLPISSLFLINAYLFKDTDALTSVKIKVFGTVAYLLQFSNYTVNFALYCILHPQFRKSLMKLCCNIRVLRCSSRRNKTYNLRPTSIREMSTSSASSMTSVYSCSLSSH